MPDPFFATNKTRKRKRAAPSEKGGPKKGTGRPNGKPQAFGKSAPPTKKSKRDEELSDETSDEGDGGVDDMDLRAPDVDPDAYESGDEDEDETPAEKRLRLAKLYLENVKQGLSLADGEFDAAEIDKELISARLKQDVLQHSGKVHLFVADSYDYSDPPTFRTRGHAFSVTAAVASEDSRWMYTSGKDGCIIKWDLHTGKKVHKFHKIRPPKVNGKGKGKARAEPVDLEGHTDEIWALALSPDGRLLASGGKDRRVGVWDVDKNEWVKDFSGHRDSISALAFRKTSAASTSSAPTQLYTGSYDRTLKLFDLSPNTMGYVETLFGHQAPVLSLDALMRETAVSVGGRDKSVRFWKIPEESQLVFRGGGRTGWEDALECGDPSEQMEVDGKKKGKTKERFMEGSVECVAMVDETTFLSGGDSGTISLWSTQKKKPIFTQAVAHGMDESHVHTEDVEIVRKPRWITALGCLRYSDLFASGSWDGVIRLWKLDAKLRSFSQVGVIPALGVINSLQFLSIPQSQLSGFTWVESHSNGEDASTPNKTSSILVAGVGQEMRLGRWIQKKGEGVLNGALVIALSMRTP
ncbi:WD40 repeat-like protein [Cristinia sonorae]|uniref:WD40 repeat-like protein n=1 Tax=Cristinia sonorae TaxID=1940300 RepID=A0A8K0XNP4_9AGAR|nr:WD40 repeat-like protein [Cristinia sonorae]